MRFERVAAAFHDVSRVRLGESSGSEHSPESFTDLSDLVNSFIERDGGAFDHRDHEKEAVEHEKDQNHAESSDWSDSETKDTLQSLFGCDDDDGGDREEIRAATELAIRGLIGDRSSPGFKRQLMARLRDRGFDAG